MRPKRTFLELCVFLGRAIEAPQVRRVDRVSKSKLRHTIPLRHRDEVEPPITDWLAEAYELSGATGPVRHARAPSKPRSGARDRTSDSEAVDSESAPVEFFRGRRTLGGDGQFRENGESSAVDAAADPRLAVRPPSGPRYRTSSPPSAAASPIRSA